MIPITTLDEIISLANSNDLTKAQDGLTQLTKEEFWEPKVFETLVDSYNKKISTLGMDLVYVVHLTRKIFRTTNNNAAIEIISRKSLNFSNGDLLVPYFKEFEYER